MAKPKICVLGASNTDLISYVKRAPHVGETLNGERFLMGFGGKGANQAVMAAKLGAEVSMITKVGRDVFGENTLKNFEECGVSTEHVLFTEEAMSGVAPIIVDADGNNSIVVVTGANDLLTVQEIENARKTIASAQILICQLEVSKELTLAALRIAKEEGVSTFLNPSPAQANLPDEFFELTDVLCPNEGETRVLSGMDVDTEEQAEAAARRLMERGAGAVVLTLGERGCLLFTDDNTQYVPAVKVKPLDTTGAGDCFLGSLAFFVGAGLPMAEAMARANRIAAMSVQVAGTQTSYPVAGELPGELLGGI